MRTQIKMDPQLPKQIQDKLMQFQNMQNQMQMLVYQKQQLTLQMNETDNAISELANAGEGQIFKTAGPLLIETSKEASKKELAEVKETAKARLAILEKQEKKLNEKINELKEEMESVLKAKGEGESTS